MTRRCFPRVHAVYQVQFHSCDRVVVLGMLVSLTLPAYIEAINQRHHLPLPQ